MDQYLTELEEDSTYVIGGLVDDTVQSQVKEGQVTDLNVINIHNNNKH